MELIKISQFFTLVKENFLCYNKKLTDKIKRKARYHKLISDRMDRICQRKYWKGLIIRSWITKMN